jgi:hypothetical protein
MKQVFIVLLVLIHYMGYTQETGTIAGILTDKEINNEPLAFANVVLKNTTKGTTSDFDGLYEISGV